VAHKGLDWQTNSKRCREVSDLWFIKDHVKASSYADQRDFSDCVLSAPISATVKTPASASMLPMVLQSEEKGREYFSAFLEGVRSTPAPPGYEWIAKPVQEIARLVEEACGVRR
jgi:hypothetical protein